MNTGGIDEARSVLALVRPDVIRIDADAFADASALEHLLLAAQAQSARLVVKRVDSAQAMAMLENASANSGATVYAQGSLAGLPHAELSASSLCQPAQA